MGSCRVEAVLETEKQLEQGESGPFQSISTKASDNEGAAGVASPVYRRNTLQAPGLLMHWTTLRLFGGISLP